MTKFHNKLHTCGAKTKQEKFLIPHKDLKDVFPISEESIEDYNLYEGIELSSLAYFVVIGLLSFMTPYYRDYPEIIWGMALIEICVFSFRKIVFYNLKKGRAAESGIFCLHNLSRISLYFNALSWSGLCILTFVLYGFVLPTLIILLSAIGIYSSAKYLNKQVFMLTKMNEKLRAEILCRESVEKALRTSEELYRTLFEDNPIETIIVDHNAVITGLNSAKKMTTGRVPKTGDIMYKDYGAKHENDMYSELINSMKTGCKKEFPEQKYHDNFLFIKISPFSGGAIITSLDITEQKNAEQQIQELTREIMIVQEKERKRISRDLHDSVAQELSTLRISCETFFDDLFPDDFEALGRKINNISKVLQGSICTVRDIAYELRPPCLDEFGLGTTLYRYCEDFSSKTGIKVDFFSAGFDRLKINAEVEINIYRLIQESLNNIKKHANARNVTIRLVASFPHIILRIEDNGQGFEKELQKKTGNHNKKMGLRGMTERINLLGGNFKINTKVGKGTNIVIEIPMAKNVTLSKQDDLSLAINP